VRPLILSNEIRSSILKVVKYAEEHRIPLKDMLDRINDKKKRMVPPGDSPDRTIDIPIGYRVTFTIEQQRMPLDWVRHISVSIDMKSPDKSLPSLMSVQMLMIEFGMRPLDQKNDIVFLEDIKGGEVDGKEAVNIVQKIHVPPSKA
jgi:hypothetical protein